MLSSCRAAGAGQGEVPAGSWELEHKKIDELLQEVETENAELDTRRLALEEKNEEALRELQLQAELQA